MTRRSAAAGLGVLALVCSAPASAAGPVVLPWPGRPLVAAPPLAPPTLSAPLNRFRGRIEARTTIAVGVGPGGVVTAATAVQSFAIRGFGDYVLTVPAPALDARRGPGSDSEPGLRKNAVVWQGFSPGARRLVARIELRPADVSAALPLRVALSRSSDGWLLEVRNTTTATIESFTGKARPAALAGYVGALRRLPVAAPAGDAPSAEVSAIRPLRRTVSAGLAVTGTLTSPGAAPRRFAVTLGGGASRVFRISSPGAVRPRLALTAVPVRPELVAGPLRTLDAAIDAALSLSLTRAYESFLVNPDPLGSSRTTYRYAFVGPVAAPAEPPAPGRRAPVRLGLLVVLGLATPALVLLWARS